jgi:hypothetical protein
MISELFLFLFNKTGQNSITPAARSGGACSFSWADSYNQLPFPIGRRLFGSHRMKGYDEDGCEAGS